MDKELEKLLKDLNKTLDKFINKHNDNATERVKKVFDEAIAQECKVFAETNEKGKLHTKIEGNAVGILITLAGLEKSVLEQLAPPKGLYEMIKETVGVMEAGDNE